MNEQRRIVVMGGSFNPPTIAHLRLLRAAVDGINADMGIFVPSNHTYVKIKMRRARRPNEVLPEELRLEMLRAMCAGDSRLSVDDVEYNRDAGKSYETMVYLQQKYPDARLYFLLGADKLKVFPRWNPRFIEEFKIVVFKRDGLNPEEQIMANDRLREYRDAFVILNEPEGVEGISSTAVRERMRSGESMQDLLHEGVLELMKNELKRRPDEISSFRGEYGFLSNFHRAPVHWEGLDYLNSEAAFQAAKLLSNEERMPFTMLDPSAAKRMGRRVQLRSDWEQVKTGVMEEIVRAKFNQNTYLAAMLLQTGDAELIEGNTWGDTCWGVDMRSGKGENRLGMILMKVRAELREKVNTGE